MPYGLPTGGKQFCGQHDRLLPSCSRKFATFDFADFSRARSRSQGWNRGADFRQRDLDRLPVADGSRLLGCRRLDFRLQLLDDPRAAARSPSRSPLFAAPPPALAWSPPGRPRRLSALRVRGPRGRRHLRACLQSVDGLTRGSEIAFKEPDLLPLSSRARFASANEVSSAPRA